MRLPFSSNNNNTEYYVVYYTGVTYNFALGTEKSMAFHRLVLAVSCDISKHTVVGSVSGAVTNSKSTAA